MVVEQQLSYKQMDEIVHLTGVDMSDPEVSRWQKIAAAHYYMRHLRGEALPDFEVFYDSPDHGPHTASAAQEPANPTMPPRTRRGGRRGSRR
jgi:hypothetical protein